MPSGHASTKARSEVALFRLNFSHSPSRDCAGGKAVARTVAARTAAARMSVGRTPPSVEQCDGGGPSAPLTGGSSSSAGTGSHSRNSAGEAHSDAKSTMPAGAEAGEAPRAGVDAPLAGSMTRRPASRGCVRAPPTPVIATGRRVPISQRRATPPAPTMQTSAPVSRMKSWATRQR